MLPLQVPELEVEIESETDHDMSNPLSPARLAIARCIELAYRRGCEVEELERRAKTEAKEDKILGKMIITADRQGLEKVVLSLEQVWIRWNLNKSKISVV